LTVLPNRNRDWLQRDGAENQILNLLHLIESRCNSALLTWKWAFHSLNLSSVLLICTTHSVPIDVLRITDSLPRRCGASAGIIPKHLIDEKRKYSMALDQSFFLHNWLCTFTCFSG